MVQKVMESCCVYLFVFVPGRRILEPEGMSWSESHDLVVGYVVFDSDMGGWSVIGRK
jgi:hypothetical protein